MSRMSPEATESPLRVLSGSSSSRLLGPFGYCPEQRMKGPRPGPSPFWAFRNTDEIHTGLLSSAGKKPHKNQSDRPDCVLLETSCDFLPWAQPSGISFSNPRRYAVADVFYVGGEKKLGQLANEFTRGFFWRGKRDVWEGVWEMMVKEYVCDSNY